MTVKLVVLALVLALAPPAAVAQTAADGTLDIYFIDVEGGQSTLIVTPAGQTLLVDAGFPAPARSLPAWRSRHGARSAAHP